MKLRAKILAELVKANPGLSKQVLGLIADKLAKKVTEESEIEGVIAALDDLPISIKDYADFLQKETDRRVTAAAAAKPKPNEDEEDEEEDTPPANPPKPNKAKDKGGNNEIAQLTSLVAGLATTVNTLIKKDSEKTFTEKLHMKLKEKEIPLLFAKRVSIEKEEDIDALVEEIEADYIEYQQGTVNQDFNQTSKPQGGNKPGASDKVDPDIVSFAKKQTETLTQSKN